MKREAKTSTHHHNREDYIEEHYFEASFASLRMINKNKNREINITLSVHKMEGGENRLWLKNALLSPSAILSPP